MSTLKGNSRIIAYDETFERKVAQKTKNNSTNIEEKGYTAQLLSLGKICRFVEYFDNISLEEQQITSVGPFEDPKETKSFKNGYKSAQEFINAGLTERNYREFVKNYEQKYIIQDSKRR